MNIIKETQEFIEALQKEVEDEGVVRAVGQFSVEVLVELPLELADEFVWAPIKGAFKICRDYGRYGYIYNYGR